jgi:hypothetical protein
VVEQPVHGGGCKERVGERANEFLDVAVGGDHEGSLLVALPDDLVEVEGLLAAERTQAEFVEFGNAPRGAGSGAQLCHMSQAGRQPLGPARTNATLRAAAAWVFGFHPDMLPGQPAAGTF